MSDTRFTLIGIGLIFVGFIVLGIFGSNFIGPTIEAQEFDDCYEYFDDKPPVPVNCDIQFLNKTIFFALVIALIGSGIVSLIKGVRGKWDQDVKPEDMLGPGGDTSKSDKSNSDEKD